jgi:hypothetical protein
MATAIGLITSERPRMTVLLRREVADAKHPLPHEEQHTAIVLLDALCLAFSDEQPERS